MSTSLPLLRATLPSDAPRWVLSVEGHLLHAPLPPQGAEDYALATLNNALCAFTPARIASYADPDALPVVRAAIERLSREGTAPLLDLCRRIHQVPEVALPTAPLSRLPAPHPAPPVSPAPRHAPADACVLGIDVGGTDAKIVAVAGDRTLYADDAAWSPPLRHLDRGEDFPAALCARIDAALSAIGGPIAAIGGPIAAIGLSWPDIVVNNAVVGATTGKTAGLRARHGGFTRAYFQEFDAHIRPLARTLSARYGVPVVVVNDGPAAAVLAASVLGRPGVLCLSLGTSVAGGLVGRHGTPLALPAYTSGMVVRLDAPPATAHRITGLPGVAQQLCSQAGAFRQARGLGLPDLPPKARLQALLDRAGEPAVDRVLSELGEGLADVIDETRFWVGHEGIDDVVVFGRLVGHPTAGPVVVRSANDRVDVDVLPASVLGRPWGLDPELYGQALGAALLALDAA